MTRLRLPKGKANEIVKRTVEMAIEEDEQAALEFIESA
jgi:hypothetical protein